MGNYAENIRTQANEVYSNYLIVENATKYELDNIGMILGTPMKDTLQSTFAPAFLELVEFEKYMNTIVRGLEETSGQNRKLKSQTDLFETDFDSLHRQLMDDIKFENCKINKACSSLISFTEKIKLTSQDIDNVSKQFELENLESLENVLIQSIWNQFQQKIEDMSIEIEELQEIISEANVTNIIIAGHDAIDSIPEMIEG